MTERVNVTQEVTIQFPATLDEVKQFVSNCDNLGVPGDQLLKLTANAGYSDFRESSPAWAKVTGSA